MEEGTPGNGTLALALGRRVSLLRRRGNRGRMTQEQFAKRVGISDSYVEKIESGARPPTVEVVESMAGVLGVEPHDLVCDGATAVAPAHLSRFAEMLERHRPAPALVDACLASVETMLRELGTVRLVRRRQKAPAATAGAGIPT